MRRQNEISDECNEMVQKVNDVWKHIEADAETLCEIGHTVDTLFGIDITDAQVRQDLICAVMGRFSIDRTWNYYHRRFS